jgi:ethanolamine ammonia-lyase large subunit
MDVAKLFWHRFVMAYRITLKGTTHGFESLAALLAKATPLRSGDQLAGLAAASTEERAAAQMCLAETPLSQFLAEPLIPAPQPGLTDAARNCVSNIRADSERRDRGGDLQP